LSAIAISSSRPDSFDIFLRSSSWSDRDRRPGVDLRALFGALFIQFVPNIADEISKAAPWAIFGCS
jgi:branched-chain amino acid transport system permease protein